MEWVNQTPVPARLFVTEMSGENCRGGLLVAKATFELSPGSMSARLVTQDPLPLFDAQTPLDDLGELPADTLPREGPAFEVFLLAACHAARGKPTREERVSVSVGSVTRELVVTGDRHWIGDGPSARISPPDEFTRIPLTYERAFGGFAQIQLDPHSTYPIFDPLNPRGRGFNPADYASACAAAFECAPGFPVVASGPRRLPNLEAPEHRISAWSDAPAPVCWSTIPGDVGFAVRVLEARLARYGPSPTIAQHAQAGYFRAHPDWILDAPPPAAATVRVRGVHPAGPLEFTLPTLRVVADYEVAGNQGVLELSPQTLVVVAEQLRFCMVYRAFYRFGARPADARSFRLRLMNGWNGVV